MNIISVCQRLCERRVRLGWKHFWVFEVAIVLQGCGTIPSSTGVMQLGPETYRVSARASLGNAVASQKMALGEAKRHCDSLQRQTIVIRMDYDAGNGPYEVTFRCLLPGDPELVRPNLEKSPDTVIQVR